MATNQKTLRLRMKIWKVTQPDYLRIATDNARAQAADVLRAQRQRELRECLAQFREVRGGPLDLSAREESYAGGPKTAADPIWGGENGRKDLRLQFAGGERRADAGATKAPSNSADGDGPPAQLAALGKSAAGGPGDALSGPPVSEGK